MISAWAPWSIIPLMSEISLLRSDSALVVRSLMPSFAASSLIDCVSAIRNGFASFSDWAKPTVAVLQVQLRHAAPLYLSMRARLAGRRRLDDLLLRRFRPAPRRPDSRRQRPTSAKLARIGTALGWLATRTSIRLLLHVR